MIFGNHVQNISAFQWGSFALQFLWLIGIHGLYFGLSTMVEKTGIAVALNLFGITLVFSLFADFIVSFPDRNLDAVMPVGGDFRAAVFDHSDSHFSIRLVAGKNSHLRCETGRN